MLVSFHLISKSNSTKVSLLLFAIDWILGSHATRKFKLGIYHNEQMDSCEIRRTLRCNHINESSAVIASFSIKN